MTTDTDTRPDDDVDRRIARAMQTLAEAAVPDEAERTTAPPHRPAGRLIAVAAAVVLLVAGVAVIAATRRDTSTPAVPPPAAATNPTVTDDQIPASSPVTTQGPETTDNTTAGSTNAPVAHDEASPDTESAGGESTTVVAVLDPDLGEGIATTPGRIDRWIENQPPSHKAVRRNADGSIDAVSWSVVTGTEWDKTFLGEPDVALPDGTTAKRLVPTAVDTVVYAVELSNGVFTANLPPDLEDSLAGWFTTAANTPLDAIEAPDGFTELPAESDHHNIYYESGVSINTSVFEAPVDLDAYLATTVSGATVDALETPDTYLVTLRGDVGNRHSFVAWQPRPDTIVSLNGPPERLTPLASHLELTGLPNPVVDERNSLMRSVDLDDADTVLLGETSQGRFAYVHDTTDGRTCTAFHHVAFGGGGSCTDEPVSVPPPTCGSGWSAPDVLVADAFVVGTSPPEFRFTIDGVTVEHDVETGITDGTPWTYATVRESGHPEHSLQSITVTVDQDPC